jgi:hypothetical protein
VITARRLVISVILAGCVGLLLWSFTLVRPTTTAPVYKNSAVKAVSPTQGSLVLRESSVTITLAPGYTLAMQNADGMSIGSEGSTIGIPQDQIQVVSTLNSYTFLPAAGQVLSELPVGRVCAIAQILSTTIPDALPQSFSWCFQTQ